MIEEIKAVLETIRPAVEALRQMSDRERSILMRAVMRFAKGSV